MPRADDVPQGGRENAWHHRPVTRHVDRMDVDRPSQLVVSTISRRKTVRPALVR